MERDGNLVAGELRTAFHQQLQSTEVKVIELFAYVEEDLAIATRALLSGNTTALQTVEERDAVIAGICHEVENLVNTQLARQAPVAGDLRLLLSVLRLVPELERSHDFVVHLAEQANRIVTGDLSPLSRALLQQMGEMANEMWNQSAQAWYGRDHSAARSLEARDSDMDSLYGALIAELASGKMSLPVAMDMTLVARYYERLGDHAVNIAHRIEFLAAPRTTG